MNTENTESSKMIDAPKENTEEVIKRIYGNADKNNCKILIPEDCMVGTSFTGSGKNKNLSSIQDNEIILDGKLDTVIKNHGDMYKFLVTPKKYRKKIKKIDLNFTYNFDQKILKFDDIKINNKINQNVNEILKSLIFEEDRLKNKIYIKNVINKAIKAYVG